MAEGGSQGDGAVTGASHASALALLAESSAASTNQRKETTATAQETEMDRVRLKLEKARARIGSSLTQIPTGREYDSPPDASDEPVYDALEKAYNAAFLVHTPAVDPVQKEKSVGQEDKLGGASVKDGGAAAHCAEQQKEGEEEDSAQVGTLKSMCLSTIKQQTSNGARSESRDTGMTNDASARATAPSTPQSPMSARNRTSSEDGFLSTPEPKQEYSDTAMKPEDAEEVKGERADHISLKEFLVSELKVYCSHLLERGLSQNGSSDASDLARITGLQLYQDHERALMDFDDEWKRSHPNNYSRFAQGDLDKLQGSPLTVSANPFQQGTAGPTSENEWKVLVDGVKASGSTSVPHFQESNGQEGSDNLVASYKRGSNGLVVGDSGHKERLQVGEFMAQITSIQNTSAFYVVVAAGSDLALWEKALSSSQLIQLYPYWGSKEDRQNLLQLLSNEYFSSRRLSAHVLLTSYEVFMEDISVVTSLQCQLSVIDIPRQATDQISAIWPQLLSIRCRQRLLLCHPAFDIDARKLLHFLVPELFSSRRKLLAWNSAALHISQIRQVCDVVKTFTLISNSDDSRAFITNVESYTKGNCEREMTALHTLDKQGIVRAIEPSIILPARRHALNKRSRHRVSGHIPAKGKIAAHSPLPDVMESRLTIQAPKVPSRKRTESDIASRSRQRIGRCGKCTGCLTEDCMKCGHCQDMKKYGGPGLRKQSCKNRKCLNPKIWGYATRKRKRSKTKRADGPHKGEGTKGDSEDDGSVAYSSVESDGESASTATYGNGDSDEESLRYSDVAMDSPRDLLLPASDTLSDDYLSLSDLSSRSGSARQRVVRCGECEGCHAPDCMKCPHCLDMKKYGGPGLRKQTCKKRKCNAPKILMLNKAKSGHDQYVDENGNVVYSGMHDSTFPGFYEAPDAESTESGATSPKVETGTPSVIQECELFVKPHLVFACTECIKRFGSKLLLDFHERVEHSPNQSMDSPTKFEREASRMLTIPIYQNAMLNGQLNREDRSPRSSPLGYAKLQGLDFQYFFIEPLVVLGRMEARWCKLYKDAGFGSLKGLAGGEVNCHVGNDSMISTTHAVISWDAHLSSFVIECLSLRTPISVNGREISFSSPPAALSSRNLVQIGASVFYFLLPKTATKPSSAIDSHS